MDPWQENIFESIDRIVDELFENYLSRPDVRQPILTQYCDGHQVQCRNRGWMTQWGSKALGDQDIPQLRSCGASMETICISMWRKQFPGFPSWPGYDLTIGVTGERYSRSRNSLMP